MAPNLAPNAAEESHVCEAAPSEAMNDQRRYTRHDLPARRCAPMIGVAQKHAVSVGTGRSRDEEGDAGRMSEHLMNVTEGHGFVLTSHAGNNAVGPIPTFWQTHGIASTTGIARYSSVGSDESRASEWSKSDGCPGSSVWEP